MKSSKGKIGQMKRADEGPSIPAAAVFATALITCQAFAGASIATAAVPLYVLGPPPAVDKALSGQAVRACAPAVVSLPESFEHLRTPPDETPRAVALKICEVMVVGQAEVERAAHSLRDLDVAVQVAPLGDAPALASGQARTPAPAPAPADARLVMASTGPASSAAASMPASVAATSPEDAETLFYQAFEALQQEHLDDSIALFERGLRLSPTNHFALFYLATAYERANQPARARPLYERVTSLAPDTPESAQARDRLSALRASGAAAPVGGGRFSGGIYIDPASPSGTRSIRDVFERSPMASGEDAAAPARSQRGIDLPPPPVAERAVRPAPAIQAPAIQAPAIQAPAVPASQPAPETIPPDTATAPASTPVAAARLSRPEATGIGTGRLPTRMGVGGRAPASGTIETIPQAGERATTPGTQPAAAAPEAPSGRIEAGSVAEEARLAQPTGAAEAAMSPGIAAITPAGVDAAAQEGPARIELGMGAVYLGSVEAGRPHGQGVITYPDGSTYRGWLESGERSGPGVLESSEGWRYEGQFRNGRFNGRGTLTFVDGSRYEGEFQRGERTGDGVYTWPGGARYEGVFAGGVIVGPGVYVAADGSRYDGEFAEGRRTGNGTLTLPDGRTYVGSVANGVPEGRGSFYWPDGRRFAGTFSRGAARGAGVLVHPDGRSESGVWESEPWMADLSRVSQ